MAKFKKGDQVRVRSFVASPYRGRIGVVAEEPFNDSFGLWYAVRFQFQGLTAVYLFIEETIEQAPSSSG